MGKGPRIDCSKDKVMTQQNEKDDADINVIVERARRGAALPMNEAVPRYADLTEVPRDLRVALNQLNFAKTLFMSLDPKIRFRFQNDPVQMLDFLADENNRKEAVELGLVNPTNPVSQPPSAENKAPA